MNKLMMKWINKGIEKKVARIEKELKNMSDEEFQANVEEALKMLDKNLSKLESK